MDELDFLSRGLLLVEGVLLELFFFVVLIYVVLR